MSEELVVYENHGDIAVNRPPEQVLAEAQRAAKALGDVVSKKKKPVMMNGEQYLEFEDWQTVGRFYGVTAKVLSTDYIEYGEVKGFQAKAVAMRADGMEISAADAMCLNDENNWKSKPLFQLRSMAQTRACAKALRNVLAWVVVLAGYRATPAEEIQDMAQGKSPIAPPQAKKAEASAKSASGGETTASGELLVKATIEKTSSKEGKKGNKTWALYGILAGGIWYNTFDRKLFDIAEVQSGKEVEIIYTTGEKGKNLINIRFEGCTGNPATCEISSFDGDKPVCGDNGECQFGIANA